MGIPKSLLKYALLPLLTGCVGEERSTTIPPSSQGPGAGDSEASREARYMALARKFGETVLAGDLDASYAMLSSHYQARFTREQYRELWGKAWAEYGEFGPPKCVDSDINMVDPDMIREEGIIPEGVPPQSAEATAYAVFVVEGECDNSVRCWEAWLLYVNQDGQDRIADIDFMWCD